MSELGAKNWRPLIAVVLNRVWPEFHDGPKWIEAQVHVESDGRPAAESGAGAKGLLQLMPGTAADLGVLDPIDPEQNLTGGVTYLRQQYEHLGEIPDDENRVLWALASYNGGRGYVNRALKLAHMDEEPQWWRWDVGRFWLMNRDCLVVGRFPDYQQIWTYVRRIRAARPA